MSGYRIAEAIRGLAVLLFLAAIAFVGVRCMAGCKPVEDPSAHHQAIVTSLAHGVRAADKACASIARAKADPRDGYELAKGCAFAYDAARLSLDAAEDKLDAETEPDVACDVAQALAYANQMAGLIEKHGGKLPKAFSYALPLASALAGYCHG